MQSESRRIGRARLHFSRVSAEFFRRPGQQQRARNVTRLTVTRSDTDTDRDECAVALAVIHLPHPEYVIFTSRRYRHPAERRFRAKILDGT